MTDFNVNASTRLKQNLKRRVSIVLQRIELLKKKDGFIALLKPERMRPPRRSRAGFTLGETLFVLLVVITVLVSVVTLYNGIVDTTRTIALRSQLTRAVAIIERDHSQSGRYTAVSLLGFLNNEGFSDKELHRNGPGDYEFRTPYDTPIAIGPDSDPRHFVVTVSDLPPSACEATVSAFSDRGSGLDKVLIGSEDIPQSELTDEKISDNCDVDDTVTVTLTF